MPNTFRMAMEQSGREDFAGVLAKARAEDAQRKVEQQQRVAALARAEARRMRDTAIARIHELSYSRKLKGGGGKLVPRRKELRGELEQAMTAAKVYANLARPEHGYPRPPRAYDPEFPAPKAKPQRKDNMDYTKLMTERNRLTFWLSVLESRKATDETRERVAAHIERLEKKLRFMGQNDHIRKTPGTKTYTLRPAPRVKRGPIVEYR